MKSTKLVTEKLFRKFASFTLINLPLLILVPLLILSLLFWVLAAYLSPINPDAGYYLTAGKYIASGLVPFKDFPTSYSPGSYYIFAIGELLGSEFGLYQKTLIYCVHLFNGLLLSFILLQLRFNYKLAYLGGSLMILMTFTLDGQAIVLEPFQNLFLLLAILLATKGSGIKKAFVVGLLVGCALMIKQTSMLSIPIITAIVVFPSLLNLPAKLNGIRSKIYSLGLFCFGAALPFTFFCVFTEQSFIKIIFELITFSGNANSYVLQEYSPYEVINTFVNADGGERLLIPLVIMSFVLVIVSPKKLNLLFTAAFCINLMTIIFVRGYPHYIQLLAPWGILVLIALISELKISDKKMEGIILTLFVLPIFSPVVHTCQLLRVKFEKKELAAQKKLTLTVNSIIKNNEDTIVFGHPWLYYTSQITPPKYDLGFIQYTEQLKEKIVFSKYTIVMPDYTSIFNGFLETNPKNLLINELSSINYEGKKLKIYSIESLKTNHFKKE
jgi:hypothetical protein